MAKEKHYQGLADGAVAAYMVTMSNSAGLPGLIRQGMPASAASLDQRTREIFRLIVESYLNEGEPVGSRNLSRILPVSLSPATIRNVMSDLEALGLIYAPHISAGRLPTQLDSGFSLMVYGGWRARRRGTAAD